MRCCCAEDEDQIVAHIHTVGTLQSDLHAAAGTVEDADKAHTEPESCLMFEISDGDEVDEAELQPPVVGKQTTQASSWSTGDTRRPRKHLVRNSEQMAPEVAKLVSFRGQKNLFRASRLSLVMQRGAAVLQEAAGSEATYALSEEVDAIDVFLSHNWSVSRVKKLLCLMLHFNMGQAVAAWIAAMGCIALAASFGIRLLDIATTPAAYGVGGFEDIWIQHGWGCTVLSAPVIVTVAGLGHELRRCVGLRGCRVFLDKTCIHQSDKELQQMGIQKLGAFLRGSSKMFVMYSDVYLKKLWTVYEVACFLCVHPSNRLIVVPTFQPKVVFGAIAILYTGNCLMIPLNGSGLGIFARLIVTASAGWCLCVVFRKWSREIEAMKIRVAEFEVHQCLCSCEEDRPFVYQNISLLMQALGKVDPDTSEQDALEVFGQMVRMRLSQSLTASIGPLGMQYRHVAIMFMTYVLPTYLDVRLLGDYAGWESATRYRISLTLYYTFWTFGFYPLAIAFLSVWCSRCLHWKGCREWVYVLGGMACDAGIFFGCDLCVWNLALGAVRADVYMVILGMLAALATTLAVLAFTGCRHLLNKEEGFESEVPATGDESLEVVTASGSNVLQAKAAQEEKWVDALHEEVSNVTVQ